MRRRDYESPVMTDDETVELRRKRDAGDPPSPITVIPSRKQSHLPSISEIHHLRLSLNEKLMHANNNNHSAPQLHPTTTGTPTAGKRTKPPPPPFVTAPSSPISSSAARKLVAVSSPPSLVTNGNHSTSATDEQQEYNDLHLYLIREHYKSQKSFVHSNHDSEMRRVHEMRQANQQLIGKRSRDDSSSAFFKRNSFLRNSWNVIMRQSIRLSQSSSGRSSYDGGKRTKAKKVNSVEESAEHEAVTVPRTPANSKCSSDSEFFGNRFSFQSFRKKAPSNSSGKANGSSRGHKRNSSTSSFFSNR